ncbi:malignant fibrous histiocytoma-amplified sequence 1 [Lingula anatina]|uniref:Malignant fibrous histiocytoma-amplified sequence 1 n=1 Tax=Lingula anatina TaxID=7574 RepID=A0A2R2MK70_LINAN|nr:malignant fibrous histiocytoma-amplified sequence 1 [Lingula anatina]|eukprot:XP_023930624.1 malignant fibrous histiocytoma-amplified sequence 1 [Lingula anatina]
MAYIQVAHKQRLDLLHRLQLLPQSKTPDTVLKWTQLDIDNAYLYNLPESIDRCTNVQQIYAYNNRLSSLPQSISNLPHLTVLILSCNAFTTFPITLCDLTNLEELDLDNNQLSDIPVDITRLKVLRVFSLSNNVFTAFPIALCGLTNLKELYLSQNKISGIPVDITRLKVLRIFSLFYSVPQSISNLTHLTVLKLSRNAFATFPIALCSLTNLIELVLSGNLLSDIPVDISRLKVLRIFKLHNNAFTTFPTALCGLTNLEKLDLSYNQLSDIPVDITMLTKLERLHLSGNKITHLPHQIKNMESLIRLDVDRNPLVQPPKDTAKRGLGAIKRYFEALTDTKAIQSSRIQVNLLGETEAGKTSISGTLQNGKSTLTKTADRTRVVEQGLWEAHEDETDQNIGFNINDFGGHDIYKIGHPIFISKLGLVFITFDLSKYDPEDKAHYQLYIGHWIDKVQAQMPGIQLALIGTHIDEVMIQHVENKCFAINKQHEDHLNKKKQWYQVQKKSIEKRIRETPKIQASLHQAYQSKSDKLQTLYDQMKPIHKDIFRVSSKTCEGVKVLQDYLISFSRRNAEVLPGMWVEAAKNICTKKIEGSENTLGWEMIKGLILQNAPTSWKEKNSKEETDRMICDILSFLAHRGDIIWFDRCPSLMKVVFHKQEVLVNVLKAVLSHDQDAISEKLQKSMKITGTKASTIHEDIFTRGIISKEAMGCLCEPFKLSSTEVDVMIEMMQTLELCYQVQDHEYLPSNTSFHFPWLLTEERQPELDTKWPSKVPPDTTQLTLQVLFPYKCPDGLYEKFSVRQHKYLGLMKTKRMDWKDGVYAEVKKCKMQLTRGAHQSNPDAVSQDPDWFISIAVRGSKLSDMWGVLAQSHHDLMNIIEEDWPGLPYDKYLMCPHCVSENSEHPYHFPGEILDLTLRAASKLRQVTCVNTGVSIPADLVYPPHLAMSWQEVLQIEKPRLCEKITEPCLKDMLNKFLEEGIITLREDEMVRAEPPQHHDQTSTTTVVCPEKTAVFLDILKTRGDEAFDLLRKCLTENGQSDLASLLR